METISFPTKTKMKKGWKKRITNWKTAESIFSWPIGRYWINIIRYKYMGEDKNKGEDNFRAKGK